MATSRQPTLSDKERALIEAARREAVARKAPPAMATSQTPSEAPIQSAPSMQHRIAMLMAAEQEEKARRAKLHQRWKIAGGGLLLALLLWWAMVVLRYMHH